LNSAKKPVRPHFARPEMVSRGRKGPEYKPPTISAQRNPQPTAPRAPRFRHFPQQNRPAGFHSRPAHQNQPNGRSSPFLDPSHRLQTSTNWYAQGVPLTISRVKKPLSPGAPDGTTGAFSWYIGNQPRPFPERYRRPAPYITGVICQRSSTRPDRGPPGHTFLYVREGAGSPPLVGRTRSITESDCRGPSAVGPRPHYFPSPHGPNLRP